MKTYVCLAISFVLLLSFDVSANSSFFEVKSNSQELRQFKQDGRTHVFPDNGLSWLDKREYIMTGEITEKGCHFSDVSTSAVREIEVEEAVNRATCQSLVAKGTLTSAGWVLFDLVKSLLSITSPNVRTESRFAAAPSAIAPTYYHAGKVDLLITDGNNPITKLLDTLLGTKGITTAEAIGAFTFAPNSPGDNSCLSANNGAHATFGGHITPGPVVWSVLSGDGCGVVYPPPVINATDQNGNNISGVYPPAVQQFCASLYAHAPGGCGDAISLVAAGAQGVFNNNSNLIVFDCTADGGATIDISAVTVTLVAPAQFTFTKNYTISGPTARCTDYLASYYTTDPQSYVPCSSNPSACN